MATTSKKRPPLNKVGRTWESIIDGQTSPGPSFEWYGHEFIVFSLQFYRKSGVGLSSANYQTCSRYMYGSSFALFIDSRLSKLTSELNSNKNVYNLNTIFWYSFSCPFSQGVNHFARSVRFENQLNRSNRLLENFHQS